NHLNLLERVAVQYLFPCLLVLVFELPSSQNFVCNGEESVAAVRVVARQGTKGNLLTLLVEPAERASVKSGKTWFARCRLHRGNPGIAQPQPNDLGGLRINRL